MSLGLGLGVTGSPHSVVFPTNPITDNIYAWYDLTRRKSDAVVVDGSNNITRINDLSGNSRHATQSVVAETGQYTSSGIGGKYDLASLNLGKTFTTFFVINKQESAKNLELLLKGSGNNLRVTSSETLRMRFDGSSQEMSTPFSLSTDLIVFQRRNNTAYKQGFNTTIETGVEAAWVSDFDKIKFLLVRLKGLFSEAIIYNVALSDADVTTVMSYLSAKYGITI
jgi:hypothetical protein